MLSRFWVLVAFTVLVAWFPLNAGDPPLQYDRVRGKDGIRLMFYNAENLFHPYTDSLNPDQEFTPQGSRHWTMERYQGKLTRIARVIIACGGWEPPAIVGLCEIENRRVLYDLVFSSPLKKYGYRIVHQESKDPRGIDVALIYRPDKVDLIRSAMVPVRPYESDTNYRSRDILHARVALMGFDTVDVFVNHWPSRRSGQISSSAARIQAAQTLCRYAGGPANVSARSKTIIMGDFNDEPMDDAMSELQASFPAALIFPNPIFLNSRISGSLVHDAGTGPQWFQFDQFIVSRNLTDIGSGFIMDETPNYFVFARDWMLQQRESTNAWVPRRTYDGFTHQEGFSDHLPVVLDLRRS